MKKQVVVIHGGDSFETKEEYLAFLQSFEIDSLNYFTGRDWKNTLQEKLGEEFQVIAPRMPNQFDARYAEWKIWFEKIIPLLNDEVSLVGHSLGGTFLAKYLAENMLGKKITGLYLVAPAYDAEGTEYSMCDFVIPESLEKIEEQCKNIFLYQSTDDDIVPPLNAEKFLKKLSTAKLESFSDRGHFNQESFPELVENIKAEKLES
jgi:predicted alpha/beta hydrolase family esterase